MHLGIPALLDFFGAHKEDDSLVLVTIVATEGSTYRKPGAMMLVSRDKQFEGMISGGCLEGDLLHHAENVFAGGKPRFVTYDMHANDDLVWNLGLGCDGVIHLLLQRLDRQDGFGFLQRLELVMASRHAALLAISIDAEGQLPLASVALLECCGEVSGHQGFRGILTAETATGWPRWRYKKVSSQGKAGRDDIMLVQIPTRTRVLVCGGGPDAVPVAQILSSLDWEVLVVDHRPAYIQKGRFPERCRVIEARPGELAAKVDLDQVDAAVVMSHHLENDSLYLGQLAGREIAYIGCLGPAARSVRLKEMAGCPEIKLYGPVGLDIGAELPEAIALSLAAEIHAVLNNRSGLPLISMVQK